MKTKTKKIIKKKRLVVRIASILLWVSGISMVISMGGLIASVAVDKGHGEESQFFVSLLLISFLSILFSVGFYGLVTNFKIVKVKDEDDWSN